MSSDTQEEGASVERRPNVDIAALQEALREFLENIDIVSRRRLKDDLIYPLRETSRSSITRISEGSTGS
jgi:hypothetical protein